MVLELHTWGPAFSLPSLDPKCLAAVAYFTRAVPEKEWVLIPSSDPSLSPKDELPVLKDGATLVAGFESIVEYLRQYSNGEWDLDSGLNEQQTADAAAFSSFIEYHGRPLLALSLYVSSLNYASSTRPAYAQVLSWPNSWILPPRIRAAAKKCSEHLGLSSLDVDSTDTPVKPVSDGRSDQIPASLISKPKRTVTNLLSQGRHHSQFRLDALCRAFCEPLADLLKTKPYFLSASQPSSLDCLALGYLSLALVPELPHPWLRDALTEHCSPLISFTTRFSRMCFGQGTVKTAGGPESLSLPWKQPEAPSVSAIAQGLFDGVADSVPFISHIRANNRLRRTASEAEGSDTERAIVFDLSRAHNREFYMRIFTVVAATSTLLGYMFYIGLLQSIWSEENGEDEQNGDFGAAGELLGLRGPSASTHPEQGVTDEPLPGVQVEVVPAGT